MESDSESNGGQDQDTAAGLPVGLPAASPVPGGNAADRLERATATIAEQAERLAAWRESYGDLAEGWRAQDARARDAAAELTQRTAERDEARMAAVEAVRDVIELANEVHSLAELLIGATGQSVVVSDLSGRYAEKTEDAARDQLVQSYVARLKASSEDAAMLDWLDARRVVVMRTTDPRHDDAWKVETASALFIRPKLRDAIRLAMAKTAAPVKD